MTAVIQRAAHARVTVDGRTVGEIDKGLLVLLGVSTEDTEEDARFLADKICGLRIFTDDEEKMNRSVLDENGGLLIISNFTLCGDCRKGRRPSFSGAARPEKALPLYERFMELCRAAGVSRVEGGEFGAHMKVDLVNDGPVTLIADTGHLRHHTGGNAQ